MNLPNRATLKATTLWAGRWLLQGSGEKYCGPVRVIVQTGDGSDAVEFAEEFVSSETIPNSYKHRSDEELVDFLLRNFVSEEEALILFHLTQRIMKGSTLIRKTGMDRTRFEAIAANLIQRGLVRKAEDGFEIADPMMEKVLSIKKERQELEAEEDDE